MTATINRSRSVFLALSASVLAACATPVTSTIDQANDVDFSALQTFAWISDEPYVADDTRRSELVNPVNLRRVRATIAAELENKGYQLVDNADADFVVGFTLGARDRIRVQNYYQSFGYRFGGFNRFGRFGTFNGFYPGAGLRSDVRTITEGTLAVDLFDNRSRQAIWSGTAARSLTGDPSGMQLIPEAVAALIGPLPEHPTMAAEAPADPDAPRTL